MFGSHWVVTKRGFLSFLATSLELCGSNISAVPYTCPSSCCCTRRPSVEKASGSYFNPHLWTQKHELFLSEEISPPFQLVLLSRFATQSAQKKKKIILHLSYIASEIRYTKRKKKDIQRAIVLDTNLHFVTNEYTVSSWPLPATLLPPSPLTLNPC